MTDIRPLFGVVLRLRRFGFLLLALLCAFALPASAQQSAAGGQQANSSDQKSKTGLRPYIGLGLQAAEGRVAQALGIEAGSGEIVRSIVPGGPADIAGVRASDLIVAVNGTRIRTGQTVADLVSQSLVGAPVSLELLRQGQRLQVRVISIARPTEEQLKKISSTAPAHGAYPPAASPGDEQSIAGLKLLTLTPAIANGLGMPANTRGAVLNAVEAGSPASQEGLQKGDVIEAVNGVDTPDSASAVRAITTALASPTRAALILARRGAYPGAYIGLTAPASDAIGSAISTVSPTAIGGALAASGPRYALVIGNAQYGKSLGTLPNPINDAQSVAAALKAVGFNVDLVLDADQKAMKRAISRFGERLESGGHGATALFYYAGHGVQSRGTNYLIPVSAPIEREADLDLEAVAADTVLTQMEDAGATTSIVILDACRNMPLSRSFRSASRGLARMDAPNGSFIAYSTAPGATAADGDGRNSPFAAALVKQIGQKGTPIEIVFRGVRKDVLAATAGQQTPWDSSSLVEPFYFAQ